MVDNSGGSDLPTVPLRNLVSLSSGDFIKAKDYRRGNGDVIVVGAGGAIGRTHFEPNAPARSIVIGRVGAAGAAHYFGEPVFATDNTLIAVPNQSLRPRFLFHFLRSVDWQALQWVARNHSSIRELSSHYKFRTCCFTSKISSLVS